MTRTVAALLSIALVVSAAACGGDKGKYKPSGGNAAPASTAPVSEPASEFNFPPDLKILFESPEPSNQDHKKIVNDLQYFFRAYHYAAYTRGKDVRYRSRIADFGPPEGRLTLFKPLTRMAKKRQVPTGRIRYFKTRVAAVYGVGSAVETCVDESQFARKNATGGKQVTKTPKQRKNAIYKAEVGMRKGNNGTWNVTLYQVRRTADPRSKECQQ